MAIQLDLETLTGTKANLPQFLSHQSLPPVRKLFIPDPGYVFIDADLIGAEAQYVAAAAGGAFRADFRRGVKIHQQTMEQFFHDKWLISPSYEPQYTKCKNMAYGTTYAGGAPGISSAAAIPLPVVRAFQPWFFDKYPGIREWHHRTELELYTKRTATNYFGFRIYYFDRPEGLLPQALAWQPQSSIGIVTQRAQRIIFREFRQRYRIKMPMQVHDSIIFGIPISEFGVLAEIKQRLSTAEELSIPFPSDPLLIPWDMKASCKSWGHAKKIEWETMRLYTENSDKTKNYFNVREG